MMAVCKGNALIRQSVRQLIAYRFASNNRTLLHRVANERWLIRTASNFLSPGQRRQKIKPERQMLPQEIVAAVYKIDFLPYYDRLVHMSKTVEQDEKQLRRELRESLSFADDVQLAILHAEEQRLYVPRETRVNFDTFVSVLYDAEAFAKIRLFVEASLASFDADELQYDRVFKGILRQLNRNGYYLDTTPSADEIRFFLGYAD